MFDFFQKTISYNRVFIVIYKKVRFVFNLIRCTNRAKSINTWNLIVSIGLNRWFVIAYPKFNYFFFFHLY